MPGLEDLLPDNLREALEHERSPRHQRFHKSLEDMSPSPDQIMERTANWMKRDSGEDEADRLYQRARVAFDLVEYTQPTKSRAGKALFIGSMMYLFEGLIEEIKGDAKQKPDTPTETAKQ
jgi:hypothetical protein